MRAVTPPHYFNIFPTGDIPVPVCIGDLPLSDYVVSQETLAEGVASYLQNNPQAPGVILMKNGRLTGLIPRHKMFERLGKRYGVELFLRKPISEMEHELGVGIFTLKSHLQINIAVKLALSRQENNIYDPIIVEYEDGSLHLLDMYVLLLTQSQLLSNMNGIISSLNHIESVLSDETPSRNPLELILQSIHRVVPFHHACILLPKKDEFKTLVMNEAVTFLEGSPESNSIYRSVLHLSQPMCLEDVKIVPAWKGEGTVEQTRSWMGIPVSNQYGPVGLISLSRFTLSPFSQSERELAQVFTRYVSTFLIGLSRKVEMNRIYQKMM
jgi:hypothetical protein